MKTRQGNISVGPRAIPWAVVLILAVGMAAQAQEPVARFDFGTADSPVQAGFSQVTATTEYATEQGYGWETTDGLRDSDKVSGDDLQRDFIYRYASSGDLKHDFLLDLQPGKYALAFLAGDMQYNRTGLPFDILLNGQPVIENWRNRGWEFKVAPAEVKDEALRITFRSSQSPDQRYSWWFCNALIVFANCTPEDAASQMQALFDQMRAERYAEYEEVIPEPAPDEGSITDEDRARGYVAFARDYLQIVYPHTRPSERERSTELTCWATPGEYEPVSFAVVPLKNLGRCKVEVTDLARGDAIIPADSWDVRLAGIIKQRIGRNEKKYRRGPKILYPGAQANIPEGDTRWWWLTVRVPDDQPAGRYVGEVVFTPQNAQPWRCPVRMRVLPFKLAHPEGEIFGMYYGTHYAYYPENRAKHFQDLHNHLIDTITLSNYAPSGGWPDDGELKLDFSAMDEFIAEAQSYGLTGPMPWGGVRQVRGLIPQGLSDEEWNRRYQEIIRATTDHGKEKDWPPLLCYPVDEPAHKGGTEQALKLLGLIRKVRGALTYCTPNSIASGTKLIHLMDYACWQHLSANADTRQMTLDHSNVFWYYSSNYGAATSVPRFRSGLLRWRLGATGMFYWHYNAFVGDPYDDLDAGRSDMYVTAPTPDGPLPTLGWECEREGIEDVWYLRMLERLIGEAPATKRDKVIAAQATLDELRASIVPDGRENLRIPDGYSEATFHRFRHRIADHIMALL